MRCLVPPQPVTTRIILERRLAVLVWVPKTRVTSTDGLQSAVPRLVLREPFLAGPDVR